MSIPITGKLEIQFVPGGAYVDVSAFCQLVTIFRPRATLDSPAQTTTLTATLLNAPDDSGYSPFSPDSPAAVHYPNIERDRLIRFTATWAGGASTSRRYFGWIDLWKPDAGGGSPSEATVTVTASCIQSRYARRRMLSDYGEAITALPNNDYWPYDDPPDSVWLRGLAVDTVVPAAQVVQAVGGTGSMSLGQADNTILVDGIASFSRGDSQSPSPVITHTLRGSQIGRVSAWIKLTVDPALANDDAIVAHDASGAIIWRLAVNVSNVPPKVQWQILDANGTMRSQWTSGYPRDESWHWISAFFYSDSGTPASGLAVRDKSIPDAVVSGYVPGWPRDPGAGVAYLLVGGRGNPKTPGKQVNTLMGDVSSLHVAYGAVGASLSYLSAANFPFTGAQRAAQLDGYSFAENVLMGGGLGHGDADATPVMLTGTNVTELDAWAEHARTTGGRIITQPSGQRRWDAPSAIRPTAVSLTLDAEADLHMPAGGWQGERIERPTRVTASSPAGSVRVVDATTEAVTGVRLDGPDVVTAAGDVSVARSAAAWVIASGGKTRLSSFGLDATLTATDKVSAIMALLPGRRVRITNLPVGVLGYSYMDVYASGWTETYNAETQSASFTFDTDPADDPPSAIFDDAEYGRFALPSTATITGGTCIGTITTGTVIITSTSPLTNVGGQYPMDLDWNGERITISGVGGTTSPQTATVTARGVAPTVPRDTHIAGETVDVWHAMTFG